MHGIALSALDATLSRVPSDLDDKPIASFDFAEAIGPKGIVFLTRYYNLADDAAEVVHNLPAAFFEHLGVERAAMAIASSKYSMSSQIEREIEETSPVFTVLRKIRSSLWRWGMVHASWNETVDAYEGLRAFDLGIPGLEVTLDHTTSYNERGYSEHSRTFLDGVFAYLLHWKGEHVMTIGFSFTANRGLLLQQVQLKNPRGNRWLFRLPANRMEFVIDRLAAAFPEHRIHVADGADIAGISLASYRSSLERARKMASDYDRRLDSATDENVDYITSYRDSLNEDADVLAAKIAKLEADLPRLAALYRDTGAYRLGDPLVLDGIKHYAIAA